MQKGKKKIFLALFLGLLTCVSFAFGALGVSAANYYNADGSAFSWSFDANGVSSQIPYSDTVGTPVNAKYGMLDPDNNYSNSTLGGSTFVLFNQYVRMDLGAGIDENRPFDVNIYIDENPGWTPTGAPDNPRNRYLTLALFNSVENLLAYNQENWWDWSAADNTSVVSYAFAEGGVYEEANRGKILTGKGAIADTTMPAYGDFVRQWHKLTFYAGTTGLNSSFIQYGNDTTFANTPFKTNVTGYSIDDFSGKIYFSIGAYGSGMQIKAKISQPYSFVNFEANGGSIVAKQLLANGTKATEPTAPVKSGFRFMGWYTDAELTTRYDFNTPITADTTIYAKWRADSLPVYTVDFNANGGSGSMTSVNDACEDYVLPDCGFTAPEGRFFKGWATSADGDVINETSITVNENMTLYAIWGAYNITFHANGGLGTMAPINGITGEYTLPQCTFSAPAGKQFKGWAFSQNGIVLTYTTIAINSDVELYAIWETIGGEQPNENPETEEEKDPPKSCGSVVFAPSTAGLLLGVLGIVFAVKKKRDE